MERPPISVLSRKGPAQTIVYMYIRNIRARKKESISRRCIILQTQPGHTNVPTHAHPSGPCANEATDQRRRKETRSEARSEQLCIKIETGHDRTVPVALCTLVLWGSRVFKACVRASIRVSHDCRCSRDVMLHIKPPPTATGTS